ncbi:MAG TPA: DUF2231 domain-containing protein [Chromatiales bacterium]|nr:DUF2231 domain-containing protein [Thiotrichales bacterium]HIP69043.1 DUF2231 domain-containing protein [Chromatiales bacterium]
MIEIIPNWHPILVHFTIGLLSTAVLFYLALVVIRPGHPWEPACLTMAKGCLWLGTLFAIATAIAGWLAYNSVAHDTPSHAAMTEHRNWALVTLAVFIVLALWSLRQYFKGAKRPGPMFILIAVIAGGLLASTGWHGGEAVYRYGLGVMSLPEVEAGGGDGHSHSHGDEADDSEREAVTEKPHAH